MAKCFRQVVSATSWALEAGSRLASSSGIPQEAASAIDSCLNIQGLGLPSTWPRRGMTSPCWMVHLTLAVWRQAGAQLKGVLLRQASKASGTRSVFVDIYVPVSQDLRGRMSTGWEVITGEILPMCTYMLLSRHQGFCQQVNSWPPLISS